MRRNTELVFMNHVSRQFPRAVPGVLEDKPEGIDMRLTRTQWWDFVNAVRHKCNAEVITLYMNQAFGDGRYLEDALRLLRLTCGDLLMIEMPYGHNQRKPERIQAVSAVREALDHEGIDLHHIVNTPDELLGDGGDTYFSKELQTLFVGISTRSNVVFADYLERELNPYEVKVVRAEVVGNGCLHLITGSSLLDDYTAAIHAPSFRREGLESLTKAGLRLIETDPDEFYGANFFEANGMLIGDAHSHPRSCEIVSREFELTSVHYDQTTIKNGSFTCDTVRVPI